jgi:hypothetical protein
MISGYILYSILLLLAAWLGLLVAALRKRVAAPDDPNHARGLREYLTIIGLAISIIVVTSMLLLHASWLSPVISQRLGNGALRILSFLVFWPAVVGFIISIGGSGRVRFLATASCFLAGMWMLTLSVGSAISMGASLARHPIKYFIPDGYIGWVSIEFGVNAPPLQFVNGAYICRIPSAGLLQTSSSLEEGWARDEYSYYSESGNVRALKDTGWGAGGMIWGGEVGYTTPLNGSEPKQFVESFYVGTEQQFRRGEGRPKVTPN